MLVDAANNGLSRQPAFAALNKVLPLAAGVVALTLQAPAGAAVVTQEWRSEAAAVVASVDKDGRGTFANLTLTGFTGVLKAAAGVVAGGATTSDMPEGTNLYYTDERVDDRVAALLVAGGGITLTYDDAAGTLTITNTVSAYTDEMAQDAAASLIQNGTGISWSYNDVANTLTPTVSLAAFSTTNLSEGANLYYTDERVDDRVSALLVAGAGITLSYNDAGNALTVSSSITQYTDEMAQDAASTLIQNGTGISWSYNDAANTLTPTVSLASFSTTNLSEGSNLYYTDVRARAAITGTASRITVTLGVVDISASYVGQSSITTLGTIATGTWSATTIATTKGGTGLASYNSGDLLYASAANVLSALAKGTANQLLGMNSGATAPEYKTLNGTTNQVTVTHAANSITLALPQSIDTGASPTFTGLTTSANLTFSGERIQIGGNTNNAVLNSNFSMYFNIDSDNDATTELFKWGKNGATTGSTSLMTLAESGILSLVLGDFKLSTAGAGLYVKEGSNATMGVATLVLGVATVSTTKVTANSRIFLTPESLGTITSPVAVAVTARSAGTSFTITSANLTDTSTVAWVILEPA